MYLTDEQITLLEQLSYINEDVAREAEVTLGPYDSVENLLQQFDEEALQKLENQHNTVSWVETEKWAALIRQIKSDKSLYNLKIVNKNDDVSAMCFVSPSDPDNAIVIFRGSNGKEEWIDNGKGLGTSDTQYQKMALDYIENLPYDSITVTGHSKGGNKAQYVTILSDKVDRCISMDGQGFSQEFIDKYSAEIRQKADCIKNYYLDGDFVNILMFPVPGAEQICIKGDQSVAGANNHCASSFYHYYQAEDGHWYIQCDGDNQVVMAPGTRADVMEYLHNFTTFMLNVMPLEDREKVGTYLGNILALQMVDEARVEVNGTVYTHSDVLKYALSDPEMFATVMAYMMKYIEAYNVTGDEVNTLIEVMTGKESFLGSVQEPLVNTVIEKIGDLLNLTMNQIRDGKDDPVISPLLGLLGKLLSLILGYTVDLEKIWKQTEEEYHDIPGFDAATARNNASCKNACIRDFSERTYNILMQAIADAGADTYESVSGWKKYAGEDWYDTLLIPNAVRGINLYAEKVAETSRICRESVERIYGQADQADRQNAGSLSRITEEIRQLSNRIREKSADLGV